MAAVGFLEELELAVSTVARFPARYPAYVDGTKRFVFPYFPFNLIYEHRGETVVIVAVSHQRRGPRYWADRGD
jgi:plasmid stabilization system protein ParE